MMKTRRSSIKRQLGSALLEALFGILIFSTGILALMGLQVASIKQVSGSKYRTDASLLVNELIGQMWVTDRTASTLQTNFASPGGAAYQTWLSEVQTALPGASGTPPVVTVTSIPGGSSASSQVTVNVFWKAPNEPATEPVHSYTAIAQIK